VRRKLQRVRSRRAVLTVIALGFSLAACSSIGGVTRSVTPIRVEAGRAAGMISAYRSQNGLGSVRVSSKLMEAAADYARAMGRRDKISHGIGGSLPKRVAAVGYNWGAVAENLGAGYASLEDTVAGWKASAGHRRNLLNPGVTEIGIAAVATPPGSKHRNYWALILAGPQPDRVVAGPFGMELVR
jgi:uncharacterized protein YkwD